MIDKDPTKLWQLTESALNDTKQVITASEPMLRRYFGNAARSDVYEADDTPENQYFQYVATMSPQVAFKNPKVEVYSTRDDMGDSSARFLNYGLNQWVEDVDLVAKINPAIVESFFRFGMLHQYLGDLPGYQGDDEFVPQTVRVERLEGRHCFVDPDCKDWDGKRYAGHRYTVDKDDLVDDEESDTKTVLTLPVSDEIEEGRNKRHEKVMTNQVTLRQIWVPEIQLAGKDLPPWWDKREGDPTPALGYHGTLFTLAAGQGGAIYAKHPKPFYGPPWGPYTLIGIYEMLDWALPLAPLAAVKDQIDNLNDLTTSANEAARRHKVIGATDTADKTEKLNDSKDGDFIALEGFDKNTTGSFELGGLTQTHQVQVAMALERNERNLGLSSAKMGMVKGDASATEQAIANDSGNLRTSWVKAQVQRGIVNVLKTASWWMWTSHDIRFPLRGKSREELVRPEVDQMEDQFRMALEGGDLDAAINIEQQIQQFQQANVEFWGGHHPEVEGESSSWYDLDIRIDAYSMENTNSALAQRRAVEVLKLVTELAPIIVQTPYVKWDQLLEWVGETINRKGLGEFLDVEQAMEMAEQMMGMQQEEAMAGGQPGQASMPGGPSGGQMGSETQNVVNQQVANRVAAGAVT